MLLLASLLQMTAAQPVGLQGLIRVDDMPDYVLQGSKSYRVQTWTLVAPDGKPLKCDVEYPSGERRLDKHTCSLIMKRAKFGPVKWTDGTPAHGLYRMAIGWSFNRPMPTEADLTIAVVKLPKGMASPAFLRLIVAVDELSQPQSCSSEPRLFESTPTPDNAALVAAACSEFLKRWKFITPADDSGRPVRTIQNASVEVRALEK